MLSCQYVSDPCVVMTTVVRVTTAGGIPCEVVQTDASRLLVIPTCMAKLLGRHSLRQISTHKYFAEFPPSLHVPAQISSIWYNSSVVPRPLSGSSATHGAIANNDRVGLN